MLKLDKGLNQKRPKVMVQLWLDVSSHKHESGLGPWDSIKRPKSATSTFGLGLIGKEGLPGLLI